MFIYFVLCNTFLGLNAKLFANKLPTHVVPRSYDLKLKLSIEGYNNSLSANRIPNPTTIPNDTIFYNEDDQDTTILNNTLNGFPTKEFPDNSFFGDLNIMMGVIEDGFNYIRLNAANTDYIYNIQVESIEYWHNSIMSEIKIEFVQLEQQLEMLTIMLDRPLYKGDELAITIKYYGNIITKGSVGVFLASYLETNKETNEGMRKFLVSTMFQPHFARRMVPCFDEPQFKAIWKVEVIHPSLLNAISNGKILQIEALSNGWTKTSFDVTPIMSSYLLAVAITEFEFEDVQTKNCTLRFWAQDTNNSRFKRFKSISKTVFDYLSDYFGMNFSLEVLNSVIIPTELKFTGMENWGLISYQNKTILLDDSIPLNFRSMVHIITHELVHQWIGNIVTYETFKQLWLNEGIAEFITDITTEILFPEAQLNKHFFLRWQRIAIGVDYNNYKYPLENDHDDLRSYPKHLYLAYKKGYGIEKMIYHILGPEVFKSSIREYLKAFKFSNVNSDKYFSILQLNADRNNITVNFDLFKNEWVLMRGCPIIHARRIDNQTIALTQSYRNSHISITNETLLHTNLANESHISLTNKTNSNLTNTTFSNTPLVNEYLFTIPIWYNINNEEQKIAWLTEKLLLPIDIKSNYNLNPRNIGWYIVDYGDYFKEFASTDNSSNDTSHYISNSLSHTMQ